MSREMQKAVKAIKAGDLETGRKVLSAILREDKDNEEAWLWLSRTMTDPQKKRQCLQRVLALNPHHEIAQRVLDKMDGRETPAAASRSEGSSRPTSGKMPPPPPYIPQDTLQKQAKTRIIGIVAFLFAGLFLIGGLVAIAYGMGDARSFTLEKATAEVTSWEIVATGSRANLNVEYTYEVDGQSYERSQRLKAADELEAQAFVDEYGLDGYLPPTVYYESGAPEAAAFVSVPAGIYDNLYVGGILLGISLLSTWLGFGLRGSLAKVKEAESTAVPAPAAS